MTVVRLSEDVSVMTPAMTVGWTYEKEEVVCFFAAATRLLKDVSCIQDISRAVALSRQAGRVLVPSEQILPHDPAQDQRSPSIHFCRLAHGESARNHTGVALFSGRNRSSVVSFV